jgi:hypothetical protein
VANSDDDGKKKTRTRAVNVLLAELEAVSRSLTLAQRSELKILVELRNEPVNPFAVEWLVDLGLVIRVGNANAASSAGRYVASVLVRDPANALAISQWLADTLAFALREQKVKSGNT